MGLVLMGAIRPLQLPKGIKRAQWGREGLHVGELAGWLVGSFHGKFMY